VIHRRKKKKKNSIPPLGAGCRFCNRDAHHSKCKPMRKRERALQLYRRSLSLFMWQHGSCTLTNSAAWKIPVVDYILPLNLECAKNLCELRLGSSLVWFPNLKTARQGTIYTISLGKRQGLTIQTELWSSFTCWKMRCQWTYAVVFIHSN